MASTAGKVVARPKWLLWPAPQAKWWHGLRVSVMANTAHRSRRYFVLLGNDLCYFADRLTDRKGGIDLSEVRRVEPSASNVCGPVEYTYT